MLKTAFPLSTHSGFVAFDGGGAVAEDAYRVADGRRSIVQPPPVEIAEPPRSRSPTGAPCAGDAAVGHVGAGDRTARPLGRGQRDIIAMCGYFVFGFFNVVRG